MTKSVLREKFARLGPTLDDDRVSSGTQRGRILEPRTGLKRH